MKYLLPFIALITLISCGDKKAKPLTTERLNIITNTRLNEGTYITYKGNSKPIKNSEFRELLKSLIPIIKTTDYKGKFDISLHYHAGMNPTEIKVHIAGDSLIYKYGQFTYLGGSSTKIQQFIETLNQP